MKLHVDFNMLGMDGKTVPALIRVGDEVDLYDPDMDGLVKGTVRAIRTPQTGRNDVVVLDVEPELSTQETSSLERPCSMCGKKVLDHNPEEASTCLARYGFE